MISVSWTNIRSSVPQKNRCITISAVGYIAKKVWITVHLDVEELYLVKGLIQRFHHSSPPHSTLSDDKDDKVCKWQQSVQQKPGQAFSYHQQIKNENNKLEQIHDKWKQ